MESEILLYVMVRVILPDSPFLSTKICLSVVTANGLTVDQNGDVWVVDTSSSFFFRFDSTTQEFTKYITTTPPLSSYGNVQA